jgi:hypothetical protein
VVLGLRSAISRRIFLAGLLASLQPSTFAQQTAPDSAPQPEKSAKPTLDEILQQLEKNFLTYHSSIPSFFCDEQVLSEMRVNQTTRSLTHADSIFRLKRSGQNDNIQLVESREIKAINGTPAQGVQTLSGPVTFSGAFSIATALITFDQKACFTYRLTSQIFDHRYIIEFATKPLKDRDQRCFTMEPSTGRAFVNPQTMQIERIECRTPNHSMPGAITMWTWSIDFGKVLLNGKTFWLPRKIATKSVDYNAPVEWSFNAAYSNYHEVTVTSRIIP